MKNKENSPPALIDWIIGKIFRSDLQEEIRGDMLEIYKDNVSKHGSFKATWSYFFDLFYFLRPHLLKRRTQNNNTMMLIHYVKTFYRNLKREKNFAAINLLGLAIGIAIFFISLLYVNEEYSYDRFHSKADNLYRIHQKFNDGGQTARASYPIGDALLNDYSEVKNMGRFFQLRQMRVEAENEKYIERDIIMVEPAIFDLFDFEFVIGSPKSISGPNDVIITEEIAEKYFENENPIGKTLKFVFMPGDNNYNVVGVVKSYPTNSHFTFSMIGNLEAVTFVHQNKDVWANPTVSIYVEIEDKQFANRIIESKLTDFVERHFTPDIGEGAYLPVMPLTDIHLQSNDYHEFAANSSEKNVYMVFSIGSLILLLAAINFINLSTARSVTRAKEVGVRKVLGAQKNWLVKQFLIESLLMTFFAVLLSVLFVQVALPLFNDMLNSAISIDYLESPKLVIILGGIWLTVGLLAGLYPSFVLSSFKPVLVLKGKTESRRTSFPLRKVLVVTQLSIVTILLISIFTIDAQLNFLMQKDMGFDRDNMMFMRLPDSLVTNPVRQASLRNELLKNPDFKDVSICWGMPGGQNVAFFYRNFKFEGMSDDERMGGGLMYGDHHFVSAMGMEIVQGRAFSKTYSNDTSMCLINETAALKFGWADDALGKEVEVVGAKKYKVAGVLKDFNFENLRKKVHPIVLALNPQNMYFSVGARVTGDLEENLAYMEETWQKFSDGWPMQVNFLDDSVMNQYQTEQRLSSMVRFLTIIAVLIAVLGIQGLSLYLVSRKTKEVGIRKVLGANVTKILYLLSKDYIILGAVSALVGIPVSYIITSEWLEEFAYRTSFDIFYVLTAVTLVIFITVITISIHTFKVAVDNPVKSLRHE